jgi:hypothetical protein
MYSYSERMQDFFQKSFATREPAYRALLLFPCTGTRLHYPQKAPPIPCSSTFKPGIAQPVSGREMSAKSRAANANKAGSGYSLSKPAR